MNHTFPKTAHSGLLMFLSQIHLNSAPEWWWYDYGRSRAMCGLCCRPVTPVIGLVSLVYRTILEHELAHVQLLGRDKVDAAEALHRMHAPADWQRVVADVWGGIPELVLPEKP